MTEIKNFMKTEMEPDVTWDEDRKKQGIESLMKIGYT